MIAMSLLSQYAAGRENGNEKNNMNILFSKQNIYFLLTNSSHNAHRYKLMHRLHHKFHY